jgi:glyoxylase-like metal-dependent hydrolase (beta-lactamase superfamily II)
MRLVAVDPDVIVVISAIWQTTCTAVRAGDEGFVIDSPVLPDELDAIPGVLEQAGFPASGLLATHGDWDHLLGRLALPDLSLGVAESTAARLDAAPGEPQRSLRAVDDEHYVTRERPLALAGVQLLPVPGRLSLGALDSAELELYAATGHTADGVAYWLAWRRVLVCGDYLSPVEIPMISEGGSVDAYLETLARLRPLVEQAAHVIPGHGGPITSDVAARVLDEDVTYLEALRADGANAALPGGRRTAAQKRIHAANAVR